MASYRSIKPKSSPLKSQTSSGRCRRAARDALTLRVSAYGYCFSHPILKLLDDFLTLYWPLQARGVLTWQLLMVLAAEVGCWPLAGQKEGM